MLFGKKNHLVGLDIGSRTVKVAELLDTKKGYSLKRFGAVDIAPGLIEEGVVKEPAVVADAIRQLFKTHNVKEQNVAISIGGYSVIVKKINVQSMTEEELQDIIYYEAEQYIPFDISEVNLDFQILGEAENDSNQMSVMLVAAKKEMVDDYVHLVQLAGLNPCIIDIDAFALQNIYEVNYDSTDDNVALIDIGASKTSLNILKGDVSVFMRDVSLGCGQIDYKIASSVGCSFEEAEELKLGDKKNRISSEELREIITSVTTDWSVEIRRALDYFYSTDPEGRISRIVLSGGGAHIEAFTHLLGAETSSEVEIINPFASLIIEDKHFDRSYLEQMAPQAAICLGLSLRRVDDK
ncbi:MAG: type IV pilus assembly protein PilM [Deltaproteobacteria bacterium]|nr:type IV pilus assembly protein PilM [Deltaproteobacteria bacterium]MBW2151647.1 type IV pilus assembly protein PilM [Deltaproteobacteria bacterium]